MATDDSNSRVFGRLGLVSGWPSSKHWPKGDREKEGCWRKQQLSLAADSLEEKGVFLLCVGLRMLWWPVLLVEEASIIIIIIILVVDLLKNETASQPSINRYFTLYYV